MKTKPIKAWAVIKKDNGLVRDVWKTRRTAYCYKDSNEKVIRVLITPIE